MSVGVAAYGERRSVSEAIKAADRALYRAKTLGRNRICVDAELAKPAAL